ncbi:MAG TPA: hypothetical protein VKD65_17100 [Candidatus Angelobacter sp.]|nr:hypothetical protein [Candidatus Angelobacter sp.]
MKLISAFAMMTLFSALAMAQSGVDFRFTQSGEFASLNQSTGQFSGISLSVSRGSTSTSGTSASLQYTATSVALDFSSITITNVFGPIPTSAFTGQTTHALALNIDTTTLDPMTFTSETCVLDLSTFLETCGAGPSGVIALQWQENDAQRSIIDLKQTTFSGPVTTKLHQKSDNSTASVQGSIFGTDVTGAPANVGVNHQSTLEITHD